MPHEYFEECYRGILERIKKETSAKIIILEQFLIPVPDKEFFHVDLDPKIQITRKLAREYADVFIPLDGLFAALALVTSRRPSAPTACIRPRRARDSLESTISRRSKSLIS